MTTNGYFDLEGGKVYYEVAGEGETLILSHAGFVDSRMWDDQWAEFAKYYRVVRFDMRGFGKSDPIQQPVNRRTDLLALMQHLNIKQAHLLGCSLSGEVIMDFALEHPEMVLSLIPVSAVPSGFEMQGEPPHALLEMFGAIQEGDIARASELQNRVWIDGAYRQPEQVNPEVRQRAADMNLISLKNQTLLLDMQPVNPLDPPAIKRLNELNVPTLIIAGSLDHPELLRAADVMEQAIKSAQKVILSDCAHLPNMEKPTEFNAAVLDFMKSI